jgi:hypothetical protein
MVDCTTNSYAHHRPIPPWTARTGRRDIARGRTYSRLGRGPGGVTDLHAARPTRGGIIAARCPKGRHNRHFEMGRKSGSSHVWNSQKRPQGPVRLPGWCNYDHRPYFAGPPSPLKSSLELQNSACRVDTYHPLKTVGIRGFWPRYARLETTHPPKVGQRQPGSTHPHLPTLMRILRSVIIL